MGVKQKTKTLKRRNANLADTMIQIDVLNGRGLDLENKFEPFASTLIKSGFSKGIVPVIPEILQINIGKLCNQTCAHCHVDAGPDRKEENMSKETLDECLSILRKHQIKTVDITGGAPEMNPHFRWFVETCSNEGIKVINRCNLTILRAHPKYYDLPAFFAKHNVELVSSLPYFTQTRTDSQRGDGVFDDSIEALQQLNKVGYGVEGSGLNLHLVFNPSGAFLPGDQMELQGEFKRQLKRRFEIVFNQLYAITNLPVSRFLDYLIESGNYESYMSELVNAFNVNTIEGLMCRNTISVSWDGYIYDCDFNQMLDLKSAVKGTHLSTFDMDEFVARSIVVNQHCYGCTAGAGSSCGGTVDA